MSAGDGEFLTLIGGKTSSKEQAQEAHAFIRGVIEPIYEKNIAEQTRIL